MSRMYGHIQPLWRGRVQRILLQLLNKKISIHLLDNPVCTFILRFLYLVRTLMNEKYITTKNNYLIHVKLSFVVFKAVIAVFFNTFSPQSCF